MDVAVRGNQPTQSKNDAFTKIEPPNTWGYLCIFIGMFRLYIKFLPLDDLGIRPWIYILSNHPQLLTLSKKEDKELMQNLLNPEEQRLIKRLKKYIV